MIRLAPAFRPTGSALHAARPGIAACYCAAPCVVALLFDSPVVLAAALAAVLAAGALARVGAELRRAAQIALPLVVLVALVNPLVSREGLTVWVDGPSISVLGNVDITAEAAIYGGIAGLRVMVVVLAFALFSGAVDPDGLFRIGRVLAPRSALTASLATRLVPVLGRDAVRLSEAARLRADTLGGDGRRARLRRGAMLTRALAAGALERAVDLAAALEVRGYATTKRISVASHEPWSDNDRAFAVGALATALLFISGRAAHAAEFTPYPLITIESGAGDLLFALALIVTATAPFAFCAHRARRRQARLGVPPARGASPEAARA